MCDITIYYNHDIYTQTSNFIATYKHQAGHERMAPDSYSCDILIFRNPRYVQTNLPENPNRNSTHRYRNSESHNTNTKHYRQNHPKSSSYTSHHRSHGQNQTNDKNEEPSSQIMANHQKPRFQNSQKQNFKTYSGRNQRTQEQTK